MGRDRLKITQLDLDHAAGIRKLSNGNLKYFYDKYIHNEILIHEFYAAMRFMEDITPKVEQVIDEAYFEALQDIGLTHDMLSEVPTFNRLIGSLIDKFTYLEDGSTTLSKEEILKFKDSLKFYDGLFDKGLLKFEDKKKSKV